MALAISRGGTGPYWTISRGTAFDSGVLALKDASGAALDLTDTTLRLLIGRTVRTIPSIEALVGTGVVVVDAEAGQVAVRLSAIQTASFASGTFVYELTVAVGGELVLQLNGGGTASRTLTGNLGEGAVPPTPDAFAGLIEGRPLLTDAISETEDFVVSDSARGPNRLGRRRLKPILDSKQDATVPVNTLGPGSPALLLLLLLSQQWTAVSSSRAFLITDRRLRAVAGCSLLTMPPVGTFGNWYQVTILNENDGQLTISGDDDAVIIENGDIATVMEVGGKQRMAFGPTSVIGL